MRTQKFNPIPKPAVEHDLQPVAFPFNPTIHLPEIREFYDTNIRSRYTVLHKTMKGEIGRNVYRY
jgi:hypothetical protein